MSVSNPVSKFGQHSLSWKRRTVFYQDHTNLQRWCHHYLSSYFELNWCLWILCRPSLVAVVLVDIGLYIVLKVVRSYINDVIISLPISLNLLVSCTNPAVSIWWPKHLFKESYVFLKSHDLKLIRSPAVAWLSDSTPLDIPAVQFFWS